VHGQGRHRSFCLLCLSVATPPVSDRAERHEFDTGAGVAGVNEFTHGKMLLSEAWTTPRESKTRGDANIALRKEVYRRSVWGFSCRCIGYDWRSFGMLRLKGWQPSVNRALRSGVRLASWDVM
jgi:hypothetical protein